MKTKQCEICGKDFEIIQKGWTRKYCFECSPTINSETGMTASRSLTIRHEAMKKALVKLKGGKCERCGYDKCLRALEFHHIDPNEKDFQVSAFKNYSRLKKEVEKCMLLCANCHAEIHDSINKSSSILE